jgi:hypothetical protein
MHKKGTDITSIPSQIGLWSTGGHKQCLPKGRGKRLALLFDFKDLAAAISAAVRANLVRRDFGFATRAGHKMNAAQRIVSASSIAATFGDFTFGMGSHGSVSPDM